MYINNVISTRQERVLTTNTIIGILNLQNRNSAKDSAEGDVTMFRLTPYNNNQVIRSNTDFSDIYDLFDDVWNESFLANTPINHSTFKVDIQDNEEAFIIEAELPGVAKEEVEVDYKNGLLTIKVEKEAIKEEELPKYAHRERRQESLQRSFNMKGINREGLEAKLENGILTITAPKLDEVVNTYKVEIK